jgi:galactokinase
MEISKLKARFKHLFGNGETTAFFAPGRVNLIGEHTDYNGGYVLPCALNYGTTLLIRQNALNRVRLVTTNFDFKADVILSEISNRIGNEWVNYPLGVIQQFAKRGIHIPGLDMLFSGDIPNGAGLSSSASIEMVTAVALNELLNSKLNRIELIKMGRAAENEFVGMNCGIMDQFVVGMGEENSALFLDCRSLDFEIVPLNLIGHSIVIANTNKRRELADSKYNERVSECGQALDILRQVRPLTDLSEMVPEEFLACDPLFPDPVIRRRAWHVISENDRVKKAVASLKSGNLKNVGILMNQSHQSLQENYEVTGFELDTIVQLAQSVHGVIGARMTGAGFGGCSVNIVNSNIINDFQDFVGTNYHKKTGLKADFYVVSLGNAAGKLF